MLLDGYMREGPQFGSVPGRNKVTIYKLQATSYKLRFGSSSTNRTVVWLARCCTMMMSKYFVVLLNVVMLVMGAGVLTLGIWGMNVGREVSHLVSLTTPTLVMLLGVVLVLVSLWGIWSAINEDATLLKIVRRQHGWRGRDAL